MHEQYALIMLTKQENEELMAMGLFQDDPHQPSDREIGQLTTKQYHRMVQIASQAAMRELLGQSRYLN